MKNYLPYKSDKPKKNYIITKDNKQVYFGAAGYEFFHQDIKTKPENKDIEVEMKIVNLDIGINPELIWLAFGVGIYYGINHPLTKVTKIEQTDF
jgi:hypothetical protein